jgi:maleate cis-trans isomerase
MSDKKFLIGHMKPSTKGRGAGREIDRILPPNVTFTSVALGIRDLVESQISAALDRIEEAAKELALRDVDAITMGGTPPVAFGGYGFDKEIIERINRVTPIPATTSQTSADEAMNLLGAKKIVLVTPFMDHINRAVITYLEDSGFQIGSFKTANAPFEEYPKIPASVPYDLSLEGIKESPDAECIFIPCAAWPVSENIDRLEKETGVPVISSAQAEVWGVLRLIGIKTPIEGYGRILREY